MSAASFSSSNDIEHKVFFVGEKRDQKYLNELLREGWRVLSVCPGALTEDVEDKEFEKGFMFTLERRIER